MKKMCTITKVLKKIQAFNTFYIQIGINSWVNDRKLIEYLNKNKNIEIGIGFDIDEEKNCFKNIDNALISFIDNQTELIVNLEVKDIYKNYDIKLNIQGKENIKITNPYFLGDDIIVNFNSIGFHIVEKEKYVNNLIFNKKNQNRYEIKTYNNYDFIYLKKPNVLISIDEVKAVLYTQSKINIILKNLNKLSLNYRSYSYDIRENCIFSFSIIHTENKKEAEFTVYHNNNIEDLELRIYIKGYNRTNVFCDNVPIAARDGFSSKIDFVLTKIKGEIDTKIISAFPSMGKTHFYQNNKDLKVLDSDSSKFSWISEGVRHPDFPNNYIQHIKENIGKVDIIFVSSHKQVRDAMKEAGIPFLVVYPKFTQKEEVCNRIKNRDGNDKLSSFIEKNWDSFFEEIELSRTNTRVLLTESQITDDFDTILLYLNKGVK